MTDDCSSWRPPEMSDAEDLLAFLRPLSHRPDGRHYGTHSVLRDAYNADRRRRELDPLSVKRFSECMARAAPDLGLPCKKTHGRVTYLHVALAPDHQCLRLKPDWAATKSKKPRAFEPPPLQLAAEEASVVDPDYPRAGVRRNAVSRSWVAPPFPKALVQLALAAPPFRSGAYGRVFLAPMSGLAVKRVPVLESLGVQSPLEAAVMLHVRHPNVARARYFCLTERALFLASEIAEGDLGRLYAGQVVPSAEQLRHWTRELCSALAHLHRLGIVHGDVKPDNVLLYADGAVRLTDFSVSVVAAHGRGKVGAELYRAPEVWSGQRWTNAIDVWALGCTLYRVASGRELATTSPGDGCKAVLASVRERLAEPTLVPGRAALESLLRDTLAWDPSDRPSAERLLQRPYCRTSAVAAAEPGAGMPAPAPRPAIYERYTREATLTERAERLFERVRPRWPHRAPTDDLLRTACLYVASKLGSSDPVALPERVLAEVLALEPVVCRLVAFHLL